MEFQSLPTLSLASFVHDALVALGLGAALLASLAFLSLGLLLPGLLTSLGGPYAPSGARYVEFGPSSAPLISEPTPRRAPSPAVDLGPRPVVRPHLQPLVMADATH